MRKELYAIIKRLMRSTVAAAADQRNLTAKASIANITTEVENDRQENVKKLAQAQNMLAKTVHEILFSQGSEALKEVGQVGDKKALRGGEEGAIENV
jgi:hypothetical protein